MNNKEGHICVEHPREPWGAKEPEIIIHSRLDRLKGREDTPERALYMAAKFHFSMEAAKEVVLRSTDKAALDSIIAHTIALGINARILVPHPSFDDDSGEDQVSKTTVPKNALPFAYAAYLSRNLGCPIDEELVQIGRVGRTKLPKWARFLYQPIFGGVVPRGQTYILADDVCSTGGTFCALRSYIVRNGGRVVFATAMANGIGRNQPFSIEEQTVNQLMRSFGAELDEFWTATIGHGITCLTEAEGRFLSEWSDAEQAKGCPAGPELLRRLRGQLDEAAAKDW